MQINTKIFKTKKSLIVAFALLLGFLMPYISRIPFSFTYGAAWIWKYMSNSGDFMRWNGFHLFSLLPILLFGLLFVYGMKWSFYASVFGHFAATFFIYYNFEEHYGIDDFLGCFLFPFPIAGASFLLAITAFVIELYLNRGKQLK